MLKKISRSLAIIFTVAVCAVILFACSGGSSGGDGQDGGDDRPQTDAHVHNYINWVSDGADTHTGTCDCDQTKTNPHEWGEWVFESETVHKRICSVCNAVDSKDHDFQNGVCAGCGYDSAPATIRSISGATVDRENLSANMFLQKSVSSLNLSNSVTTSENSVWRLYDAGNALIPTKRIEPQNGNNTYFIVVSSLDGVYENTYEFTVYKSFEVSVSYYGVYNDLLKTVTADTGYEFSADFVPEIVGYTFEHWKKGGEETEKFTPYANIALFAECRANSYEFSLDVNGGDALSNNKQSVTFDSDYTLPTPTREGHTFSGWYGGADKVDISGNSKFAENLSLSAKWQINQYKVTLDKSTDYPVTLSGDGVYDYGTQVTVSAGEIKKLGYEWSGWHSGQNLLTNACSYMFTLGAQDVALTANIGIKPEMQNFEFTSTETTCEITGAKDKTVTSITIPDYVTRIGSSAFSGCNRLAEIRYAGDIADWCGISGLYGLMSFGKSNKKLYINDTEIMGALVIPNGVTSIESSAFQGCSSLTSIEIPSSVTSIGDSAFGECSGLNKVNYIGTIAEWCNISFYDIQSNPLSYAHNLYVNSSFVTKLVIPDGVTGISKYAFYGCYNLTSVIIGNSVTSIGAYAFRFCNSLESITLPFVGATLNGTNNTHFGYIFGEGFSTTSCYDVPKRLKTVIITGGKEISYDAFYNCSSLTSIEIPNSVTSIGESAFQGCSSLTSIEIPSSVTSIGEEAFSGCSGLTSITVASGNTKYHSSGNCLIDTESKTLIAGCKHSIIPTNGSVTSIGEYAFSGCSSLTGIEIPSSVTSIGIYAFYGCSRLTSIEIPSSVTSIEKYAFSFCSSLTNAVFENTDGWKVSTSSDMSNALSLDLTDPTANAKYLNDTYCNYNWKRS